MKCPYCGADDSKVIDSRPTDSNSIRRRRECIECAKRFTTYEAIDTSPVIVIKKDGSREVFDRSKMLAGILKSCYKRPVTTEQLDKIVDDIQNTLANSMRTTVRSKELGEMVMKRLRDIDEVSYVRFASVYRQFKDAETFMNELRSLNAKDEQ